MDKNKSLISIVTVTYNCKDILEETILSVIQQKYLNIEYIIIDGGSTDGTIEIINKYQNHISYFISEKDNGIFDAMNKGIKAATGKWINFMNAGDKFLNDNTLQSIFTDKKYDNYDVIFGDKVLKLYDNQLYGIKAKPFYITQSIGMGINHQCLFTRTELAKRHPFNLSYKVSADYEMIHHLYINHAKFIYCNIPIAIVERTGFSTRNKKLQMKEEESISGSPQHILFTFWKEELTRKIKGALIHLCPYSIRRIMYTRNKNIYLIQK